MNKLLICLFFGVLLVFVILFSNNYLEKFNVTTPNPTPSTKKKSINTLEDYYKIPANDRWDCIQNLTYKDSTFSCAKEIEKEQKGEPNDMFWYLDRDLPIKNRNDPWDRWVAYTGPSNLPTNIKNVTEYNNMASNFKWQCKDYPKYTDQSPFSCKDELDKKTNGIYNGADWYFDYKKFNPKQVDEWNGWVSFVDPSIVNTVNVGGNYTVQKKPNSFTITNTVGKQADTSSFNIGGYNLQSNNSSLYLLQNSDRVIIETTPPITTPMPTPPITTPAPTPYVSVNIDNYKLMANKDKPGNDIQCYNYKDGNTIKTCENACNNNKDCSAISVTKDPSNFRCCIKNNNALKTKVVDSTNTDIYNKNDKFAFFYSDVQGNPYPYNDKNQATNACNSVGSTLATHAELVDTFNKGGDWCAYGWLSDTNTQAFPVQRGGEGCGGGGGNFYKGIVYNNRVPAGATCINK